MGQESPVNYLNYEKKKKKNKNQQHFEALYGAYSEKNLLFFCWNKDSSYVLYSSKFFRKKNENLGSVGQIWNSNVFSISAPPPHPPPSSQLNKMEIFEYVVLLKY